ncbi:GNAT family N-acetyltransferase [Xiamenia xianingshaonis]|uniref:GNAT family N-acetyltransferase n=1 Tax=Xiamenia xianingshaonis TaxID=2682776 RepID=A0A9E6MSC6_9ACTN|nr:GNAT family N-acetyltransferase [Xiamenia xianingshaonis]NHM13652.1 GNAT family N-acetyltransferase [Xiamenia xianingshaonis]QTU85024.1 GNAT family N-acetyltransferase [Xiamenia xianingshaonis]
MAEDASLFSLRDARASDMPYVDAYAYAEGMDVIPSEEGVRAAVNADDVPVGFLRIQRGRNGVAHVNPVVTCATWRGFGVGRALVEEALSREGELRLVARGASVPFYEALGFSPIPWEAVDLTVVDDCDGCEMREECCPRPMGKRLVEGNAG